MKTIAKLILGTALILSGAVACASKPKASPTPKAAASESAKTLREVFPKEKTAQSAELFSLISSSGIKPKKIEGGQFLRAYDVSCTMKPGADSYRCSVSDKPQGEKGLKSYELNKANSEKLSSMLFSLPVAQGDSGAASKFVECSKFELQGSPAYASCVIAIDLDYPGP